MYSESFLNLTPASRSKTFIRIFNLCFVTICFQVGTPTTGKCIEPGPVQRRKFIFQGAHVPLAIAYSERVSHHVTAQLTKVLLEEGLGYDNVELVPVPLEASAGSCDGDRMSCIPNAVIDTEVWVPFDDEEPGESDIMVDVGSLGIVGRQGWYTTTRFVDREWTEHHHPVDQWRVLQLHDVMQQLSRASDLITCQACAEDEFNPRNCVGGQQCVALLAGSRGNASVLVENQIKSLGLNISVLWLGSNLSWTVHNNDALGKDFLFCAWDPDPLTVSSKFKRMSFPDCSLSWTNLVTNPINDSSMGCDFPLYDIHKFVWKEIKYHYKDIYELVRAISLTREHITQILGTINTTNPMPINYSVCNWMSRSRDVWLPWIQSETTVKRPIFIGGMFPNLVEPKAVWSSPGDEIGAQMAVSEINSDRLTLQHCRIKLLVAPTQCRRELVVKAFIRYLNRADSEKVIGIVGPACSKATIPIAEVSRFHNTVLMGYAADDVLLSDRTKFPLFYRTNPSIDEFKYAFLSVFRLFGWKHCASLREAKYPVNTVQSRNEYLTKNGVQVLSRELPSEKDLDPRSYIRSVLGSKKTIIILDTFPAATRAVICQACKQGLTPSQGYVWFLVDWLEADWWDVDFYNSPRYSAPEAVPCSTTEMEIFVEQGYFTLSALFFGEDGQNLVGGGTVKQWKEAYRRQIEKKGIGWSDYASFTHDAVWTYALALDQLLKNDSTALQTIHTASTSQLFRHFIQKTDFWGVSGRVHFKDGDRLSNVLIKQKFARRFVVVGKFITNPNGTEAGRLEWDETMITWATGGPPRDLLPDPAAEAPCGVESLRKALDVTCAVATALAAVIGVTCVIVILVVVFWVLKGRYSSKYRDTKNRLRELGLLDASFSGAIFALDDWEILRENVFLNRKLGEGAFGAVFGGEALGLQGSGPSSPVAVKTLRVGATIEEKVEFLSEADNMKLFSHPNLVKLLAVCTTGEPVFIVMELMIHGDLKSFLLARRRLVDQGDTPEAEEVTPRKLTGMALDIARGLQYLASIKFVHRDLALRNCMLGSGNVIKIGDFGLARTVLGREYYRFERTGMLPVRWMSPESIREGLFTMYTDVWSYGVTLWELSSFGGFPYQGLSNAQVLEQVEQGFTLEVPQQYSKEMKALLQQCWSQEPLQRPKPEAIVKLLTENPEIISACVSVPATTLLDNSVGNFDATKATAQARKTMGSPQSDDSNHQELETSSTNLTSQARDRSVIRNHSIMMRKTASFKKNPGKLWRKGSVHF